MAKASLRHRLCHFACEMANAFEFGKGLHWPEANAAALPFAEANGKRQTHRIRHRRMHFAEAKWQMAYSSTIEFYVKLCFLRWLR